VLGSVAEFEREMIRQRVKAGMAQSQALGKLHGTGLAQRLMLWLRGRNSQKDHR